MNLKNDIFLGLSEKARKALLKAIQDLRFKKLRPNGEDHTEYIEELQVPRKKISLFEINIYVSCLEIDEEVEDEINEWHNKLYEADVNIVLDENNFVKNGLEAVSSVFSLSKE